MRQWGGGAAQPSALCVAFTLATAAMCPAPLVAQAQDGDPPQDEEAAGEDEQDAEQASEEGEQGAEGEEDARVHFRLGRVYYDSGRFAEAAREFEQAYELSDRPELLYNIFLARRDAGQIDEAITALEKYLELVPDLDNRSALEARLRAMRRLREQRGDEGGQDEQTDTDDETGPDDGATATDGEDAAADGSEPPPPPAPHVEQSGPSVLPWVVAGVGGALLVGSVVTGVLALKKESDLEGRCERVAPDTFACDPGFENDKSKGAALATATDVLVASGLAAVGAGLALFFLLDEGGVADRASGSVGCDGHGCAGSVRVTF